MLQKSFVLPLLLLFVPSAFALKVMIDPGHGGIDSGATYGPAQESQIVLKISQALAEKLKVDPRFEVSQTRSQNEALSLSARVRKANEALPDLFLSLHANATADRKAKGMEIYFQNQMPLDEENLFLAHEETKEEEIAADTDSDDTQNLAKSADVKSIIEDLHRLGRQKLSYHFSETLQESWTGHIRQAPFYVISKNTSPSVLIEVGFLSHPVESQKLLTSSYQNELAEKIYRALVQYAQKVKTNSATSAQID